MVSSSRLSNVMEWASLIALCALPVIAGWAIAMAGSVPLPFDLPQGYEPDLRVRRAAVAVGLLPLLGVAWSLISMRRLFALFRKGNALTRPAASLVGRIGQGLIIAAALRILATPAQSLMLTAGAPEGQRMLSLSLSSADIGFFLSAGLLVAIGHAMQDAARVADENRSFV